MGRDPISWIRRGQNACTRLGNRITHWLNFTSRPTKPRPSRLQTKSLECFVNHESSVVLYEKLIPVAYGGDEHRRYHPSHRRFTCQRIANGRERRDLIRRLS